MVFYWLLPNKIVIQVLWSLFITFHFFVDSENNLEWNKYDAWYVSFAFFFSFFNTTGISPRSILFVPSFTLLFSFNVQNVDYFCLSFPKFHF